MTESLFDQVYLDSHMAAVRRHVRAYREMGIAVVPLELGTKDKYPCQWKQYQTQAPSGGEMVKWFYYSNTPYNVAALLGPVSRNLLALDVDRDAGQMRFSQALSDLGYANNLRVLLLQTYMTRSGSRRGYHFLLRVSEDLLNDKKNGPFYRDLLFGKAHQQLWRGSGEHEEISLLSQGSVSVLAPSVHPSNRCAFYVWNRREPAVISTENELRGLFTVFKGPEEWAKKKRQWRARRKSREQNSAGTSPLSEYGDDDDQGPSSETPPQQQKQQEGTKVISEREKQNWLDMLAKNGRYIEGNRHHTILRLVGALYKDCYSKESTHDFVDEICDHFGDEDREDRHRAVETTWARDPDDVLGWWGLKDFD